MLMVYLAQVDSQEHLVHREQLEILEVLVDLDPQVALDLKELLVTLVSLV